MKQYEINLETNAIIGLGKNSTKVVEKDFDYIISDSGFNVMDHSCNYFGSSYEGRIKGSRNMMGYNYKVPIVVEDSRKIIFFPLDQVDDPYCMWISLNRFQKVVEENGKIYIYFKDGRKIPINVSKNIVDNQVFRATRLKYVLDERKL